MISTRARAARPVVMAPAPWRPPVPRQSRAGGVTVLAYDMPGRHAAAIACYLAVPAHAEPPGRDGIAAVTAAALLAGARTLPAARFRQQAAADGITWTTTAGHAGPVITLELPARRIPAALRLLRLALTEPELDFGQSAAQIQQSAMGIARDAASPQGRAMQELPAAIYGHATRAGRPAAGTLATVADLTPDAIAAFYDDQIRTAGVTIVIAGDLAGLGPAALGAGAYAGWRDAPVPYPDPQQVPLAAPARGVLVDRPGATQTHLILAAPVPGRGQPGWAELQIAARILGAPLNGRLDAAVRQRSGRSHGLQAGLTELIPGHGLFLVSGAVDGPATPAALSDIRHVLASPTDAGFTGDEHASAAQSVTRAVPLTSFETPAAVAATAAGLAAGGLDPGYPARYLDDIAALTAPVVNGARKSHLSPQRFTLIAVGDAAALAQPLVELAGPLQVISS